MKDIEKLIKKKIDVITDHPYPITDEALKEYEILKQEFELINQKRKSGRKGGGNGNHWSKGGGHGQNSRNKGRRSR